MNRNFSIVVNFFAAIRHPYEYILSNLRTVRGFIMRRFNIFALLLSITFCFAIPHQVYAEIVVITKALPDSDGDSWPREYFDVSHLFFEIPDTMHIKVGINNVVIHPTATLKLNTVKGKSFVEKAWVNIIDLERKRYFDGKRDQWYDLDSAGLIQIRDGFDSCYVYLKSCVRPGAPDDSCEVERAVMHDSLDIDDIAYIVYSSFNFSRDVGRDVFLKSKHYYRKLLGFITHDAPMESYLDLRESDSRRLPIKCNCLPYFRAESVRKVIYTGTQSR